MALQRLFNGTTLIWGPDVTFDIMNKNVLTASYFFVVFHLPCLHHSSSQAHVALDQREVFSFTGDRDQRSSQVIKGKETTTYHHLAMRAYQLM
jgi:hypothetical protein